MDYTPDVWVRMKPLHSVLLFLSPEALFVAVPREVAVVYLAVACNKTTFSIKLEAPATTRNPKRESKQVTWAFDLQYAQHLCFLPLCH